MFNENSALVKLFILMINNNKITIEQIPNLSNLKEVIIAELNKANA